MKKITFLLAFLVSSFIFGQRTQDYAGELTRPSQELSQEAVTVKENVWVSVIPKKLNSNSMNRGTYCIPLVDNCNFDQIDQVVFADIDNNTLGNCNPYNDFTSMTTDLAQGETYQISISTYSEFGGNYLQVFFDWSQDGNWGNAEVYEIASGALPGEIVYDVDVEVPSDASIGESRMRVLLGYTTGATPEDPCEIPPEEEDLRWGEVEDYTINVIEGSGGSSDSYIVDFEGEDDYTPGNGYGPHSLTLNGIEWSFTEALSPETPLANDWYNDTRSLRLRGRDGAEFAMNADKSDGLGTISFEYREYGTDGAQQPWAVEYSSNGGGDWTQAGDSFTATDEVQTFNEEVNIEGDVRIRIRIDATPGDSGNRRVNVDDIELTDYESGGGGDGELAYGINNATGELVTFDPDDPSVLTPIGTSPVTDFENAGAIDPTNPEMAYVLDNVNNFYSVDLTTGTYTLEGTITAPDGGSWVGISFDPSTGILYGISGIADDFSVLCEINMFSQTATVIGTTGMLGAIDIAVDSDGNIYSYDIVDDSFYSIDPDTGAATLIGALGFDALYGQGMSWDANHDIMYLSAFNNGTFEGEWRTVDLTTGATTLVGTLGDGVDIVQMGWSSIPLDEPLVIDNDNCDSAIAVACGQTVTGTTADATDSGGEPAPDRFYKYAGSGTAEVVTVSLCGGGTTYDSQLRVFTDCTLTTEVAFNDDSCGLQSELTFISDGVSTYYIMVEGWGTSSGDYSMTISCEDAIENDLCSGAQDIACGETIIGSTVGATPDTLEADECGTTITAPGLWYTFTETAGYPSDIVVSLCGSDYDTKVSVFEGECGDLVCVAGNDDFCDLQSEVSFESDGNTTYYILVHGFLASEGDFTLSVDCMPIPPPNDLIENAIDVDQFDQPYTDPEVVTQFATAEELNPEGCNIAGANGVWYKFTAENSGTAEASIVSPEGATSVIFYTADDENPADETDLTYAGGENNSCGSSTEASIEVEAGQTYFVFVLNTGGASDIVVDLSSLGVTDTKIPGFAFYPNPSNDMINLVSETVIDNVVIYNMLGQQVMDKNIGATDSQLNISNLATGTYLLKVVSEGQTGTYQLLKK